MRKIVISFLLLLVTFYINAQLSEPVLNETSLKYNLEFKFTGEVLNSVDSVFIVSCIIDESLLENVSAVILKSGKSINQLIEMRIEKSDFKNSLSKEGKVYFEIGTANEDLIVIKVMIVKEGSEIELRHIRY